jgi:orotate phosphoribosyltransferase
LLYCREIFYLFAGIPVLGKTRIIHELYEKEVIKPSALNSGVNTNISGDLRQILAYPSLRNAVADLMWNKVSHLSDAIDVVAGVVDSTLPLALYLGAKLKRRVLTVRKGKKNPTQEWVEGRYRVGESCLLINETLATGSDTFMVISHLQQVGLIVPFILTFLKKAGDASARLSHSNHDLYSVFTETEVLLYLQDQGIISAKDRDDSRLPLSYNDFAETARFRQC